MCPKGRIFVGSIAFEAVSTFCQADPLSLGRCVSLSIDRVRYMSEPDFHVDAQRLSSTTPDAAGAASLLSQRYAALQTLFEAQPSLIQRFLEGQARLLGEALIQRRSQVRFTLPDQVVPKAGQPPMPISASSRDHTAGSLFDSLTGTDLRTAIRNRLVELEGSHDAAVATAAQLLRYATAVHMVYEMLPSGRSVRYVAAEGEEIPSIPAPDEPMTESAITADTDAIAEEGQDGMRGELVVPYTPAARRFYLPQWVAFDDEGHLLVGSPQEAEAHVASMQQFTAVLHAAVGLAPYMVADPEYQRKRYGILGQLINQGRALALYQAGEIIQTIKRRAAAGNLNRGLSLSLLYFDDQDLQMKLYHFRVIPAGRIMFVPAFVVRAAREEQAKVAQDTRLNASTRKHLLKELAMLEAAFVSPVKLGEW